MRTLALYALVVLIACDKKAADGSGSGSAAAVAPPPPPADAAPPPPPVDAAPDAMTESKYGFGEATFTGDYAASLRVPLEQNSVTSDYWLSAQAKAHVKAAEAEHKREGFKDEKVEHPLWLDFGDISLHSSRTSKLKDIKQAPHDWPIVHRSEDEQKPGEFEADILAPKYIFSPTAPGTLKITRFERGELEATFEIDLKTSTDPPVHSHLVGKIVYHCAGAEQCGL
jgi:hypothetical protein